MISSWCIIHVQPIIIDFAKNVFFRVTMGSKQHFLETFIFLAELLFSYCLMLVVMSFNLWLGIAIVTGSAVGYLLCGTITNRFKIRMELKAAKNGALLKGESEGHRRHLVLLKGESEGHRRHLAEAANKTLNDSDLGNGQEIQKSDTHEREEMSSLLKKDSRGHRRHLEEEEAKDAHQRADRKGILKKRESKGMEMISLK